MARKAKPFVSVESDGFLTIVSTVDEEEVVTWEQYEGLRPGDLVEVRYRPEYPWRWARVDEETWHEPDQDEHGVYVRRLGPAGARRRPLLRAFCPMIRRPGPGGIRNDRPGG